MYLARKDLADLFHDTRGGQDDLLFYTVSDHSKAVQPKGIFIPVTQESGELSEAIANGAIAAIWDKEKRIPPYTPNQFPLFFTADPAEAVRNLLQYYNEKLDGETGKNMEITKFDFLYDKLLNKSNETYDIAAMMKKVFKKNDTSHRERRE